MTWQMEMGVGRAEEGGGVSYTVQGCALCCVHRTRTEVKQRGIAERECEIDRVIKLLSSCH